MNLHEMAEEYILDNIKSGAYKTGDMIPPETVLAEMLNISRPTMRQALSRLVADGFLTRIKGKGTFVNERKLLHKNTSILSSYKAECQQNGLAIKTIVREIKVTAAKNTPAEEALGISGNAKVAVISRIRLSENYHNGAPLIYTTVYSPADLIHDVNEVDFENTSFYEHMKLLGYGIVHTKKQLEVIQNAEFAAILKISSFEPIISIKTTGYTENGKIAEYSESYYPSSISSFDIELWNKE